MHNETKIALIIGFTLISVVATVAYAIYRTHAVYIEAGYEEQIVPQMAGYKTIWVKKQP
jgi:hypothetical protein